MPTARVAHMPHVQGAVVLYLKAYRLQTGKPMFDGFAQIHALLGVNSG